VYTGGDTRNLPADRYRIEVTLSDDGSTADVVLYNEPKVGTVVKAERDISVGSYSELYFSSYEYSGDYDQQSLRLLDIETYSATQTAISANETAGPFHAALTGLELDRDYAVRARSKNDSVDPPVTSAGDVVTFSTNSPIVETHDVSASGARAVNATGEVKDLGGLRRANLSFAYWPSRIFNEQSTNNSDSVLADGEFWTNGADGYAHDNDYVHDNRPLEDGETRTYVFDKRIALKRLRCV
jgi:hypothetical protein